MTTECGLPGSGVLRYRDDICTAAVLAEPLVTAALLDHLKTVFPGKVDRAMDDRQIHFVVGQQEVMGYLERLLLSEGEVG